MDEDRLTIAEVSAAIRERRVSPVEVVRGCLARIEASELNAFITVLSDDALARAAEAEREIATGHWRGPLHGIPIAIKDFYDTAGVRTTAAFEKFIDRVPSKDAASVARLKEAGAIILGKTNMHRLGMGTTGLESAFGAVKNPVNAEYIPGGSSSGSAAAVASGLCFATLDTDAIGSCRLPAACCGVVGFKPTFGAVSTQGILGDQPPPDETLRWLSHAGITTRSVADTQIVLAALTGGAPEARATPRVGTDVAIPRWDFSQGIANIEADRESLTLFDEVDVVILPTMTTTTPRVSEAKGNEQYLSPANTVFANYYGLPAISVPWGVDANGLPAGMQIVGKAGSDWTVLAYALRCLASQSSTAPSPFGAS